MDTNEYWDLGFMSLSNEWGSTWESGSDFYDDPSMDSLSSLLDDNNDDN